MNEKTVTGRRKSLRAIALIVTFTLIVTTIVPSITQFLGVSAEESDPLTRIYGMLSGTIEDPQTAEEYYELANIAIGQKDFEAALGHLETARGLTEDAALTGELWLKTATVYALTGDYESAKPALTSALESDPESEQAMLLQAQILISESDFAAAAVTLEKYAELVPTDVNTLLTLAQLYETMSRFAEARAVYQEIYGVQPESDTHLLNALRCGFLNGDYEDTLTGFDQYLADKPDAAAEYRSVALFLRAACLMQLARSEEAIEGFKAAMEAGYDEASCYEQIVMCSFDHGDYESTIAWGAEMIEKDLAPASPDVVYQRMGASMMQLGRYEEAVETLTQCIEINPALPGSHYYRGVSYLSLEKYEEAIADFTASIDEGFLLQFCYYNRGVSYIQLVDYESALDDFGMTLTTGDDPDLIQGAKDILWQLAAYYESQAALTAEPDAQTAGAEALEEAAEAEAPTEAADVIGAETEAVAEDTE